MREKRGFTLVELLVVIGVLGVLLAISLPLMQAAKAQARMVVCMSNLKQWGLCYELYAQDYNGRLPVFIWNDPENCTFMENYRDYYSDIDAIRFCPVAKQRIPGANPIDADRELGMTSAPWWINPVTIAWMNPDDCGLSSYGENSWIRSGTELDPQKLWKKITAIKSNYTVPMIGDARWCNALPDDNHPLPPPSLNEQQYYNAGKWRYAECFAMRRHKDSSNLTFADGSVRQIPAENMWSLKWHRIYVPRTNVDLSWMHF